MLIPFISLLITSYLLHETRKYIKLPRIIDKVKKNIYHLLYFYDLSDKNYNSQEELLKLFNVHPHKKIIKFMD